MVKEILSVAARRKQISRAKQAANRTPEETEAFKAKERQRVANYRARQRAQAGKTEKKVPMTPAERKRKSRQSQKEKYGLMKELISTTNYWDQDELGEQESSKQPRRKRRTKEMMPKSVKGRLKDERQRVAAYRKRQMSTKEGREKTKMQRQLWQKTWLASISEQKKQELKENSKSRMRSMRQERKKKSEQRRRKSVSLSTAIRNIWAAKIKKRKNTITKARHN